MCWKKLKGLFRSKTGESPPELETVTQLPPEKQPPYKLQKKRSQKVLERTIVTSRGGPNAPKKQPCPLGHSWKKRVGKALGGALYYCNVCKGEFLVPYAKRAR